MSLNVDAVVKIAVPVINAAAQLLPQLVGLFDRIRASSELSVEGRALLDAQEAVLLERKRRAEKIAADPLPLPDPKPTAPG